MAVFRLSFFVALVALLASSCGRSATPSRPTTAAETRPCSPTGTFHGRSVDVDGEQRFFLLHVPESHVCGRPIPLLVDFHGTTTLDIAEEDLLTEEAIELAEQRGFILARPRSRSGIDDGAPLFQWDINDGDIERNVNFTFAMLAVLRAEYEVDPERTYALGFSNGTNMATQFLGRDDSPFKGYALIGGGTWAETDILPRTASSPRLYGVTGYRDYMHEWLRVLMDKWLTAGYGQSTVFLRKNGSGHELYAWHYVEAWDWLDDARRPQVGRLRPGWQPVPSGTDTDLLAAAEGPSGLVVAGASGYLARHNGSGWIVPMAQEPTEQPITDICFRKDGAGLAVGDNQYAYTRDGGISWGVDSTPMEFVGDYLGHSHFLGAGCGPRFVAGGYWSGAVTDDLVGPWEPAHMLDDGDEPEHVSAIAPTDDGGAIMVGEHFIGRSDDNTWNSFQPVDDPPGWVYSVAQAGHHRWWAVGAMGQIRTSKDDGWNWSGVQIPGTANDFYAVHFADDTHGAIVGASGTVLITDDGGTTWTSTPTGLDHFLSDVIAYPDGSVVVVGEGGFIARWSPTIEKLGLN